MPSNEVNAPSYDASNSSTTTSYKGTPASEYSSLDAGDTGGNASSMRELRKQTATKTYNSLVGQQAGVDRFKAEQASLLEAADRADGSGGRYRALGGNSSYLTELDRNMLAALKMLYIDSPNNRLLKKLMVAGEDILKQKNQANPELYYKKMFQTNDLTAMSSLMGKATKDRDYTVDLTKFL